MKKDITPGTKTKDIAGKTLVNGNGHAARRLYTVPGEFNDILLISLEGEVIEVVNDLAKQAQRRHQGW